MVSKHKYTLLILSLVLVFHHNPCASQDYDTFFEPKTLRFDYLHCGNSDSESFYYEKCIEEPFWGGPKTNLVKGDNSGNHMFKIIDAASLNCIYSQSYCSLFNEWQYTKEATETQKGYKESLIFPYPKSDVIVEIYSRNRETGEFEKKFNHEIVINKHHIARHNVFTESIDIEINNSPEHSVDIVLLSEGYSKENKEKFIADCNYFVSSIFSYSPFKEQRKLFNIRAVWCGDGFEDGVSIPSQGVWKNTPLSAKFDTFYSERYQMVDNLQVVRDYAMNAPYDIIYILTNNDKYGGGGIYNFYGISSASNPSYTSQIYVHEFAHLLLGLADEYEGGAEEMYNTNIEPWETNITTLKNFESKDWSRMVSNSTPIPTPKEESYQHTVGVYEGGGYVSKGVYRPWLNCIMNNLKKTDGFCPVCTHEINKQVKSICN